MPVELKVPSVGESIVEVQIGEWHKSVGEAVSRDENVVELESEKATFDIPAPSAGVISQIIKQSGEMASIGEVIGYIDENAKGAKPAEKAEKASSARQASSTATQKPAAAEQPGDSKARVMPAAARALSEHGLRPEDVEPSGPGGRLLKEDVQKHVEQRKGAEAAAPAPARETVAGREEETVPMSPIRRRIAQRLVEAQRNAALLTTFNEVDMQQVMDLRNRHRETFQEKYGIKLGFMSFFVKAVVDALKLIPQLNAEIRENEIVYKNYHDIGIAIGGGKGLVVPVLRNAERMSFAEIELAIADFAKRARDNQLGVQELQGGTFTVSNGGVYGSLLSTPIVNPPQSGVLGMHSIQERPVVKDGQIVARPMMYIALTYDHRIVDGREAVTFLKRIKDAVEDPSRILLEV